MTSVESQAPDWELMQAEVTCPLCEYNLRGLSQPRCPECGFTFEWREILDITRRKHQYLFEHHPERNLSSFFKTLVGGLNPWRFWRTLHPAQPTRQGRLIFYALFVVSVAMMPLIVDRIVGTPMGARLFWYRTYRADLSWKAAVRFPLNLLEWPLRARPQVLLYFFVGATVALPVVMYLLLMVFQGTMRRVKVRPKHVRRCVVYSADVLVWAALPVIGLVCVRGLNYAWSETLAWSLLAMFPIVWAVMAWRLSCAYRLYLRFDYPRATVWSVQLIILLALVLILQMY
jgi:hypothetical protein